MRRGRCSIHGVVSLVCFILQSSEPCSLHVVGLTRACSLCGLEELEIQGLNTVLLLLLYDRETVDASYVDGLVDSFVDPIVPVRSYLWPHLLVRVT
jgi:hypothetical protein